MNKVNVSLAVIFLTAMIFLTAFSRDIHEKSLCHVSIIEVKKQDFVCRFTDENGKQYSTKRRAIGIPKDIDCNNFFVVREDEIYGEKRFFAYHTDVFLQEDYFSDEFYAVAFGLNVGDKVVYGEDISVDDGSEVVLMDN